MAFFRFSSFVAFLTVFAAVGLGCSTSQAGPTAKEAEPKKQSTATAPTGDRATVPADTTSIKDEARKRAMTGEKAAEAKPAEKKSAAKKAEAATPNLPALLKEIEAKYAKADTLKAQFQQVDTIEAFGTTKNSSGEIWLKRPDKLRWETQQPDPNTLVSDGETFWFYTPPFDEGERGQVIIRKAESVKTKLASALLAGSFSMAKDMKIAEVAPNRFTLTPKKGAAGTVAKATIEVDGEKKIIQKVILEHKGGNKSEITLSKVEFSPRMADDMFMFVAPPYTDVVGSELPSE